MDIAKKKCRLVCSQPEANPQVKVEVSGEQNSLSLRFEVTGNLAQLKALPVISKSHFVPGTELYKKTCFELFFFDPQSTRYFELNVSPTAEYANLIFNRYREPTPQKMVLLKPSHFVSTLTSSEYCAQFKVGVNFQGDFLLSPTVVLETSDRKLLYYALAHANPDGPDFHNLGPIRALAPLLIF